jgi:hypothetical protein
MLFLSQWNRAFKALLLLSNQLLELLGGNLAFLDLGKLRVFAADGHEHLGHFVCEVGKRPME